MSNRHIRRIFLHKHPWYDKDPPDQLFLEKPEKGLGLASMKERSKLSGGSFSIESSSHNGTTVYVSWPKAPSSP